MHFSYTLSFLCWKTSITLKQCLFNLWKQKLCCLAFFPFLLPSMHQEIRKSKSNDKISPFLLNHTWAVGILLKVAFSRKSLWKYTLLWFFINFSSKFFDRGKIDEKSEKYTDALDCYGTPKMLILVFIKFRENQE